MVHLTEEQIEIDSLIAMKVTHHVSLANGYDPLAKKFGLLPRYSTNISDAFMIVEAMSEKGFLFGLNNTSEKSYTAQFHSIKTQELYVSRNEKYLGMAICKAALKAIDTLEVAKLNIN